MAKKIVTPGSQLRVEFYDWRRLAIWVISHLNESDTIHSLSREFCQYHADFRRLFGFTLHKRVQFCCNVSTQARFHSRPYRERAQKQNNRFWFKELDGDCECTFVHVSVFTERMLAAWLNKLGRSQMDEHDICKYTELPMAVVKLRRATLCTRLSNVLTNCTNCINATKYFSFSSNLRQSFFALPSSQCRGKQHGRISRPFHPPPPFPFQRDGGGKERGGKRSKTAHFQKFTEKGRRRLF